MEYILAIVPGILIVVWMKKYNLLDSAKNSSYTKLFIFGALSIIFAATAEEWADEIVLALYKEDSLMYMFLDNFLITAFSEELGKFIVLLLSLKLIKSKDEESGCIAGIFVGLGFGVIENICYAMDGDIGVMFLRAIYCVPGHALYGLYMGYFLWCAMKGKKVFRNVFLSFFIPFLQHGLYDFSIGSEGTLLILWTMVYNLVLYRYAYGYLKKISRNKQAYFQTSFDVFNVSMPWS